jgi:hypothetical protein
VRRLRTVARQLASRDTLTATDPVIETLAKLDPPDAPARQLKPSQFSDDDVAQAISEEDYRLGAAAGRLGISRPAFNGLVDKHPTLRRAERLDAAEVAEGLKRAEATGEDAWRLLGVSERGLARRRKALGI